jgi:CubicO group peptidase (beta-lactamase class C family)
LDDGGGAVTLATPAGVRPEPVAADRLGYGALFWVAGVRQALPDGTYAMLGTRGQWVVIVPARHTIIVRRGFDSVGGTQFDGRVFAQDVLFATEY